MATSTPDSMVDHTVDGYASAEGLENNISSLQNDQPTSGEVTIVDRIHSILGPSFDAYNYETSQPLLSHFIESPQQLFLQHERDIASLEERQGREFSSLRENLLRGVETYFASHPGPNNTHSNMGIHTLFNQFKYGVMDESVESLESVYQPLIYRVKLMEQADKFMRHAKIILPGGKCCREMDVYGWEIAHNSVHSPKENAKVFYDIVDRMQDILPGPAKGQGPRFEKPERYLALAIATMANNSRDFREFQLDYVVEGLKGVDLGYGVGLT
jgi:hypothetical protein